MKYLWNDATEFFKWNEVGDIDYIDVKLTYVLYDMWIMGGFKCLKKQMDEKVLNKIKDN